MKHTQGPWRADTDHTGAFGIEGPDGASICTRHSWPDRAEESIANAHLLAAAPEMLEALRPFADMAGCTALTNLRDGNVVMRLTRLDGSRVELTLSHFEAVLAVIFKATA